MHFPDRQIELQGTCRCGRTGRLLHLTEMGGPLCEACFPESIQRRVEREIRTYQMIPKASKVVCAVSGGKDSGSLLHVLQQLARGRLSFSLQALHVNMGIGEYSEQSRAVCEEQARRSGVKLTTVRLSDWGVRVEATRRWPVCAVCGGLRRPILALMTNRLGGDVLVTGHTLDDQLVYVLKDLLSGKPHPPKPATPKGPVFPRKAKPLFHLPDRALAIYAELVGLPTMDESCPFFLPYTHRFKAVFEVLESLAPLAKKQLISAFSRHLKQPLPLDRRERLCPVCGEPTYYDPCPLCRLREWQSPSEPAKGNEPAESN